MKTIKEELTTRDIVKIVCTGLGSGAPIDNKNGVLQFQTVCHNRPGEGSYKLYYYTSTQLFHCYTECSASFDVLELVQRATGCTLPKAGEFIRQITGKYPGRRGFDFIDQEENNLHWEDYDKKVADVDCSEKNSPISTHYLKLYDDKVPYIWHKEGISIKALQKFNIKVDYANMKIIIPHWDKNNNLIGIRGRALNPCEVLSGNKYMPVKCGTEYLAHSLGGNLYGINFNCDKIKETKKVVLFEGEKSVMKYEDWSNGENISLAVCGSSISACQIQLLEEMGVEEVIIAFDKMFTDNSSKEAKEYRSKLVKLGLKFPASMAVYYLWDDNNLIEYKNAPIDHGHKVFSLLMKMKKMIKGKMDSGDKNI
ncbi:MAG: hypothetical protein J6J36_00800 [Clostridia bacterium]|nr:hypothetical protein [Clostridia bacterium]